MKIGITGHQTIDHPEAWAWVREQLATALVDRKQVDNCIYSSLAKGADQLCTELAVGLGYSLHAVVPCVGYEAAFDDDEARGRYRFWLSKASQVELLDFASPSEDAYLAAGRAIVAHSQQLLAVWDGQPAAGRGGTADIVEFALRSGKAVLQLNPDTRAVQLQTPKAGH